MITNRDVPLAAILRDALADPSSVCIASAYASPGGCEALGLRERAGDFQLRISLGRASRDGLQPGTLQYFSELHIVASTAGGGVRVARPPCHSKLYCIASGGEARAWIGSSNLTVHGLEEWLEANTELEEPASVRAAVEEADRIWESGVPVPDADIPLADPAPGTATAAEPRLREEPGVDGAPGLRLSLLDRSGQVPVGSGLNWWNAEGRGRDPNEAYIPLRADQLERAEEVFGTADRGATFRAVTHDGSEMEMVLEGGGPIRGGREKAKQIASAEEKRTFGRWALRDVLGVDEEQLVTRELLERHGRTDVCLYRIGTVERTGEPLVFLDFSTG